ncbi:MAG: hypothetical protein PHV95_05460 [Eubacteriales bacterium]|nr:hypothetical protein [Eubacteriales bacterium]
MKNNKKASSVISIILACLMCFYAIPIQSIAEMINKEIDSSYNVNSDIDVCQIYEVENKRTKNSKVFLMSDGTYQMCIYSFDIHQKRDGEWIEGLNNSEEYISKDISKLQNHILFDERSISGKLLLTKESFLKYLVDDVVSNVVFDIEFYYDSLCNIDVSTSNNIETVADSNKYSVGLVNETSETETSSTEYSSNKKVINITADYKSIFNSDNSYITIDYPLSDVLIPEDGVIMTISYMSIEDYQNSGSWDEYDKFYNTSVIANSFNGGLRVSGNAVGSINFAYNSFNAGYSLNAGIGFPKFGNGFVLNISESVVVTENILSYKSGFKTSLYYENEYGIYRSLNDLGYFDTISDIYYILYCDNNGGQKKFKRTGELVKSISSDGNTIIDYIYSNINNKLSIYQIKINGYATYDFSYDSTGRLISIINQFTKQKVTFVYGYYTTGITTGSTDYIREVKYYNNSLFVSTVKYDYTQSGKIAKITDSANELCHGIIEL